MSVDRPMEAWEEMQRHGQDLADRLTQGFTGLLLHSHITPPPFPWPAAAAAAKNPYPADLPSAAVDGVHAILDLGNRLGQAGAELGNGLNGAVQQFFRQLPVPFRQDEDVVASVAVVRDAVVSRNRGFAAESCSGCPGVDVSRLVIGQFGVRGSLEGGVVEGSDETGDEDDIGIGFDSRESANFGRSQGSVNITSTYDSRTRGIESSLVARGDLWRAEASHGSSNSNNSSPPFLIQLGPVLLVRNTTLLLPVHLSKQHLLWYGYDRKDLLIVCRGSVIIAFVAFPSAGCSKWNTFLLSSTMVEAQKMAVDVNDLSQSGYLCFGSLVLDRLTRYSARRSLRLSYIHRHCNTLFLLQLLHTLSFMDLQFPNGQLTYVAGEGLTTNAFLPVFGGLLQVEGQYPGETRFSFSCKNKLGTRITPMVQFPDNSFSLGVAQALAWRRTGLMFRPSLQVSICPTFGGCDPGLRAELIHSVKDNLIVSCGGSCTARPTAFACVSLGRSKMNENVESSGVVIRVETPLGSIGRPSFSVQLNTGVQF